MKKTTVVSTVMVVAVVACCIVGCKAREEGRYYGSKGYSIKFPGDWETQEQFMGMEVCALSPMEGVEDEFRENCGIGTEDIPVGINDDEYYLLSIVNLKKLMSDFNVIEDTKVPLGSTPSRRMLYTARMGEVRVKTLMYIAIEGERAYIVAFTAPPEAYDAWASQFDDIAKTFRVE